MVALPGCKGALALCDCPQKLCSTCVHEGMAFDDPTCLQLVLLKSPTGCCHSPAAAPCALTQGISLSCPDVVQVVSSMRRHAQEYVSSEHAMLTNAVCLALTSQKKGLWQLHFKHWHLSNVAAIHCLRLTAKMTVIADQQ